MHYARRGIITPEMEYIAIRENADRAAYVESLKNAGPTGARWRRCSPVSIRAELWGCDSRDDHAEFVRDEVARGRAIIPNNINHPSPGR
ncbi:MAG: phosphomethylpyrimidine synthase ThiC [Rhodocyclaceae bacterium]